MRETKFRAWNKIILKMATWEEILKHCNRMSFFKENDWIFMQFTGLRDKNGVEIYEGDVVVWHVNEVVRIAPIYYDEQQATFWMGKDKTTGHLVLNDWMRGQYEVIGNIYEHPELLEKTNER